MSSTTPDPAPTATPAEPAPAPAQPDNVDGLKRKNSELLGELKKAKAQVAELTASRGTDGAKPAAATDPAFDLAPVLVRSGLLARDNDLDYVVFKMEKLPDLRTLAAEGKTDELVTKLKELGLIVAPGALAPAGNPDLPMHRPPTPTPARPPANALFTTSAPPKTYVDLMRMGTEATVAFSTANPAEYERLRSEYHAALARPGRR